jgi:thiamine-phosphate pyrophosphorylase
MQMRQRQRRYALPTLWLMTDERVPDDRLLRAAGRLPRGSGIIFRHYTLAEAERRLLFGRLQRVARRHGLALFLAGEAVQAAAWGADGSHGGKERRGRLPLSLPVHDARQLREAERRGADIVFVSPLFATRSHPGANPLGPVRFAALARRARMPVMALGGVKRRHAHLVRALGAAGFGAIDGLTTERDA